eukprot:CAMPEP_0204915400 /NCGR_PEP_ID=MMETSP1397-20131031/13408_1 /ASSEMBLY_ACC=CAM_ASM_000891 /TAXON_ID=49980 /ORGANISM="Climacostomum Climacostomum virens, Strain Stock W-24" /LENGTH=72 /DNA_ID=CAMNT_0052087427 /DNA_START=554 /DNA_END=772 /DNA_ORIENTATION=-
MSEKPILREEGFAPFLVKILVVASLVLSKDEGMSSLTALKRHNFLTLVALGDRCFGYSYFFDGLLKWLLVIV